MQEPQFRVENKPLVKVTSCVSHEKRFGKPCWYLLKEVGKFKEKHEIRENYVFQKFPGNAG